MAAGVVAVLAGCGAPSSTGHASASAASSPTPRSTPSVSASRRATPSAPPHSATPTPTRTATATASAPPPVNPLAGLTLEQRVGQLFLVGSPATVPATGTVSDVTSLHVGGVFLSGRATAGVAAIARVTTAFTASDHDGEPLLIATDQEGGEVQVLRGYGFSAMPSAYAQSGMSAPALRASAAAWGGQLRAAGLDMDLGPVADVIESARQAAANPPIGQLYREYGLGAASVLPHAQAFAGGMLAAGIVPVAKHFPGLGAVTANTDFSAGVTDTTTTAASPSVSVFASLVADGVPVVMMSSAIYARLAPGVPAVFAPAVVTGLLRQRLDFGGVVMTDDVSAATQLAAWSPAERAILAIQAGVDLVLVSAAPQFAPQMIAAVVARARTDAAFAAQVNEACERVLQLKERYLQSR